MATAGIQLSLETTDLTELRKALGKVYDETEKARILRDALKKALQPALARLRALTPEGPTGNLKRSVTSKVISYTRTGNAVALIGFTRADRGQSPSAQGGSVRIGKELAYHQWWIEEGTDDRIVAKFSNTPYGRRGHLRRVRGRPAIEVRPHRVSGQNAYIASSFKRLGPFGLQPTARPPRGGEGQRVQTDPAYPRAFFKKSKTPIVIPGVRPGGINGQPPLKTAWEQTRTLVAEILQQELRISLSRALETLVRSSTGTIDAFGG